MWCVLYTHTHTLTHTHSHLLTLMCLHTCMCTYTINTQKAWICVGYYSIQFNAFWENWSCTALIQCNLIWIELVNLNSNSSIQFQIRHHLNCVELTHSGVELHWIAVNCVWCIYTMHQAHILTHLKFFSIYLKIKSFCT